MIGVYVIGCGGVGGYLVELLPMCIASLNIDLLSIGGADTAKLLKNVGTTAMPSAVDRLVLVDGDTFDRRNAVRQGAGLGGKLQQRVADLRRRLSETQDAAEKSRAVLELLEDRELLHATDLLEGNGHLTAEWLGRLRRNVLQASTLRSMRIVGYNSYVTPDNIGKIIPHVVDNTGSLDKERDAFGPSAKQPWASGHVPVVFLCVDNRKSRYEISKYMESFDDCLVINGGNDKTAGHVTIYERREGAALDPEIYEVFPEINPYDDKRPDEIECTAVAPKHDQIAVTNCQLATVMLSRFIKWVRCGLFDVVGKGSKARSVRYNEIMLDIDAATMLPVNHPKKETK